jgi:putative transposase
MFTTTFYYYIHLASSNILMNGSVRKEVRALIYTTNPIEKLNRQVKKVAKNKSIFPNDQALIKPMFQAMEEASKKWTFRRRDWAMIFSQLVIFFGDRLGKQA